MASSKPKIQGYIDPKTFDCFEAYRQENGLSQSQALERILASFFGSDRTGEQSFDSEFTKYTLEAIRELQGQTAKIEDRLREIFHNPFLRKILLNEVPSGRLLSKLLEITVNPESDTLEITSNPESDTLEIISNPESDTLEIISNPESDTLEIISNLESDTLEIISNPESESEGDLLKGISQRSLAKRLGCSHSYIGKLEKLGEIGDYSQLQDPAGLRWELRGKKYYPILGDSGDRVIAVK